MKQPVEEHVAELFQAFLKGHLNRRSLLTSLTVLLSGTAAIEASLLEAQPAAANSLASTEAQNATSEMKSTLSFPVDLPPLGSSQPVPGNDIHALQAAQHRTGPVVYHTLAGVNDEDCADGFCYPIIRINGENGTVDIGGPDNRSGILILRDKNVRISIVMDGESGKMHTRGDIILAEYDEERQPEDRVHDRILIKGTDSELIIRNALQRDTIQLNGREADITLGALEQPGDLLIRDADNQDRILIHGKDSTLTMRNQKPALRDTIHLDGQEANVMIGTLEQPGDLFVRDDDDQDRILINGQDSLIKMRNRTPELLDTISLDGQAANITVGVANQAGEVVIRNEEEQAAVRISGSLADILIGVQNNAGNLIVKDENEVDTIRLDGDRSSIVVGALASDATNPIEVDGLQGKLTIGAPDRAGRVNMRNENGLQTIQFDAALATGTLGQERESQYPISFNGKEAIITIGLKQKGGKFLVQNQDGKEVIELDGTSAQFRLRFHASGNSIDCVITRIENGNGQFALRNNSNVETVSLTSQFGEMTLTDDPAKQANLVKLRGSSGQGVFSKNVNIGAGGFWDGEGEESDIQLNVASRTKTGSLSVKEETKTSRLTVNERATTGTLQVKGDQTSEYALEVNGLTYSQSFKAELGVESASVKTKQIISESIEATGTSNIKNLTSDDIRSPHMYLTKGGKTTIHLDGAEGDIRLLNADCAEEFDVAETTPVEPGSVMVLGSDGKLKMSDTPYDKKAVGVISGAGGFKPGIIMDRRGTSNSRLPIALMGKVYCKADANSEPIEVGDLLTTSTHAGHAMKASNPYKAFGAIIGKALGSLNSGTGLIPILVSLQ